MSYLSLSYYFDGLQARPSFNELIECLLNGYSISPLGIKVELDGKDEYGFPNWLDIIASTLKK